MYRYGQYCPVARAAEIVADRWTVLIIRELLADVTHFNELERGLPHMSRSHGRDCPCRVCRPARSIQKTGKRKQPVPNTANPSGLMIA